ncbi:hypothetical protein TorRG33x02_164520 [Trema orientale]|uniref:Uncharacterized protein n=1 Tax=Trema orientale TaxID=63057 RepID=A0A2P5EQD5_TREOI|nr:hypothetical protein TorRG33x02_164520 [Trema orientale]
MLCRQCWRHRLDVSWLRLARCSGRRWTCGGWACVCAGSCGGKLSTFHLSPKSIYTNGDAEADQAVETPRCQTLVDLIDVLP